MIGSVLGLVGASVDLLLAGGIGTYLTITEWPWTQDDSWSTNEDWPHLDFGVGITSLALVLFHAAAIVMLTLTLRGRLRARTVNLVLASTMIPYVLLLLIFESLLIGNLFSEDMIGPRAQDLAVYLLFSVPPMLYVLGSFLLFTPSTTRQLRARRSGLRQF